MRPGTSLRRRLVGPTLHRLVGGGGVVLDVGGYDGSVSVSSSPSPSTGVATLVVLDLDRAGLVKANGQGVRPVFGSATAIPLASGSVDVALCLDVLACLAVGDVERVYPEIRRVLRPGGHLLVTEVDERYQLPFVDNQAAFARWGVQSAGLPYGRLVELLAASGMRVVEHQAFYGVLTRSAYSLLFVAGRHRRGFRAKHRAWDMVAGLERRWCPRPRANFVVATTA